MKTLERPQLVPTGASTGLSEEIIPAVEGKYYAYQSCFTDHRPLYALLDCKANKARELASAGVLGHEVHLYFELGGSLGGKAPARVSSMKAARTTGLSIPASVEFDDVWVAPAGVAIEDFYTICAKRDSAKLVDVCKTACETRKTSIVLSQGLIVAVMTGAHKYGLFLVKEIAPTSVSIDGCHILQP